MCDNQKYGLDKITTPIKVFNYDEGGNRVGRSVARWAPDHNAIYRRSFGMQNGGRNRCEVDEFPLSSLKESVNFAQQALRSLDGAENGRQGELARSVYCTRLTNFRARLAVLARSRVAALLYFDERGPTDNVEYR